MLIWSTGFWISTDQTSIRTPLIYYWGQGCGGGWQLVELGLKRKCMKLYSQSWIRFLAINPLQLRSAQIQPLSNFSHELSLLKSDACREFPPAPWICCGAVLLEKKTESITQRLDSFSCFLLCQSAAAAPSPVMGGMPPGDGMPGGPMPPAFFQVSP